MIECGEGEAINACRARDVKPTHGVDETSYSIGMYLKEKYMWFVIHLINTKWF